MKKEIILIGDNIVNTEDIVSIEEKSMSFSIAHEKPNPEPKPSKGFFKKLAYSDTITEYTYEKYSYLVLKVKAGTQTVLPENKSSNDDTISIGRASYGTHQLYTFYMVYNDENFMNRLKNNQTEDRLIAVGNYRTLGGLKFPNYLKTNTMYDSEIASKSDFVNKYMYDI